MLMRACNRMKNYKKFSTAYTGRFSHQHFDKREINPVITELPDVFKLYLSGQH